MQAFSAFFMKFCLALNSYNYTMNTRFDMSQVPGSVNFSYSILSFFILQRVTCCFPLFSSSDLPDSDQSGDSQ